MARYQVTLVLKETYTLDVIADSEDEAWDLSLTVDVDDYENEETETLDHTIKLVNAHESV